MTRYTGKIRTCQRILAYMDRVRRQDGYEYVSVGQDHGRSITIVYHGRAGLLSEVMHSHVVYIRDVMATGRELVGRAMTLAECRELWRDELQHLEKLEQDARERGKPRNITRDYGMAEAEAMEEK